MNLILSTILQEKERIDRMLAKYQEELGTLPRGTISEKKVKQSTYFYLKYREGKKVISRYIPQKDVDAFHAYNVGKIMIGDYHFLPCTLPGLWSC